MVAFPRQLFGRLTDERKPKNLVVRLRRNRSRVAHASRLRSAKPRTAATGTVAPPNPERSSRTANKLSGDYVVASPNSGKKPENLVVLPQNYKKTPENPEVEQQKDKVFPQNSGLFSGKYGLLRRKDGVRSLEKPSDPRGTVVDLVRQTGAAESQSGDLVARVFNSDGGGVQMRPEHFVVPQNACAERHPA